MREDLTQRRFIEETYRIISAEGREALSIRRLARDMRCNSANIYRYFKDLDELVTYASLRYLTAYLGDVAVCYAKSETTYQTHVAVWDCFSHHAFANGPIFDNLFFGRHSRMLNDIIKNYYAMFPEDLSGLSPSIANIFSEGSFNNRDYLMISRCVDEGWFTAEDAKFLNSFSIHLFLGYLKELLQKEPSEKLSKSCHDDFMATLVKIMDYFRLK